MGLDIREARKVFQNELDKQMTETLTSSWMDENAGQVIYTGGNEIKIPKIAMDGLKDYSRTDGYPTGGVSFEYETKQMTMDRGESFILDAMSVDETNFVATAGTVLGEFQRTKVVPEVDAYRYSTIHKVVSSAAAGNITKKNLKESDIYGAIITDLAAIRDIIGETYELVIVINGKARGLLNKSTEFTKFVTQTDFKIGNISSKVRSIDECPIISVPSARLMTEYDFFKGDSSQTGGEKGGFKAKTTAKQINYMIMPRQAPIAVCKQDKSKIIDPDTNQKADAWFIGYRKYHDLWLKDNAIEAIRISQEV